jgi:outer membrane biosynthesis protein TonB
MSMRHFLMIAALLCAGVAAAKAPLERSFHARVQVSAEGTVEAVETQEGLPAPVATMVQEAAQKLAFTPATVGGEPAASKTTVWVRMRFEPGEGDELVSTVLSTTQANPFMQPPRYPMQPMRDGIGGQVWLELAVRPDGSVDMDGSRVESIQLRDRDGGEIKRQSQGKLLAQAAMEAAAMWKVFPEEVAGVPLATTVMVPVTFCAPVALGDRCPTYEPRQQQGQRIPADGSVRLPQLGQPASAASATPPASPPDA